MPKISLEDRHALEEKHHDKKAKANNNGDIYNTLKPWALYRRRELITARDLHSKKVLDFGTGSGWQALEFAEAGAFVFGFDISAEALNKAEEFFKKRGHGNRIKLEKMVAEKLNYENDFFDYIIGTSILHHTDLALTVNEIHRILKPGGTALFIEPLGHNPFINLFRKLTPWRRTETEKPLVMKDIEMFKTIFSQVKIEGLYFLASMGIGSYFIFKSAGFSNLVIKYLKIIDDFLLNYFPFLKRYCFTSIIICYKQDNPERYFPTSL